jgi:hypothetical protein
MLWTTTTSPSTRKVTIAKPSYFTVKTRRHSVMLQVKNNRFNKISVFNRCVSLVMRTPPGTDVKIHGFVNLFIRYFRMDMYAGIRE